MSFFWNRNEVYDFAEARRNAGLKLTGAFAGVAHLIKGALGGGILGGPAAYKKAGVVTGVMVNIFTGTYITICMFLLGKSAQIVYRRQKIFGVSYPDLGEMTFATCPYPKLQRLSKCFRHWIDFIISVDLFGSCCAYQVIVARTVKQLVEHHDSTIMEPSIPGYPHLRVYVAALLPIFVLICLIPHIKYLAPFSAAANAVVALCIGVCVYYSFNFNPTFSNLTPYTDVYSVLEYTGISIFGMSCAGVVLPVENHMKKPQQFPCVVITGMLSIVLCVFMMSFFGYAAFLENSSTPVTSSFPMTSIFPLVLKGLIAVMIIITHALNFWVPFNICFHYIKKKIKNKDRTMFWELICRAIFVICIGLIAIASPHINELMGFLGAFCLSNMAFLWPVLIYGILIAEDPGFGKMRWKLIALSFIFFVGMCVFIFGSAVALMSLITTLLKEFIP